MSFVSYAQNFEDVLLNRVFGAKAIGFYVDIGACHPVTGSVTKAFYDRGWSGINIEPGEVFDLLAAARQRDVNLRMAVLDRTGEASFLENNADAGMSKVVDCPQSQVLGSVRVVPCDTLGNIVAAFGQGRPIDFIKIDAEGSEAAIISATDWHALRPTLPVVESTLPWSNQLANQHWEPALLAQGYSRVYFDGVNSFYAPEERPDIAGHFAVPVNVLDGFRQFDPEREELEDRARDVEGRFEQLHADYVALKAQHAEIHGHLTTTAADRDALWREAETLRADREARSHEIEQLRADYEALWQRTEKLRAEHVALRHEAEKLRVDRDSQQHDAKQLRANWDAQWQETVNLRADHDALWHEAARLRTELEGTVADRDSLRPQAEKLDRLVRELRWPGGPRALRITLPVARLIRRLHGTPVPDEALGKIGIAGRSAGPSDPSRAESQQSIAKSGALAIYRPLRPVLRPIAWRVRSFLTAQLGNDLMRIQGELQNLRQELALTETRLRSNIVAGGAGDPVLAELGKFSQALEATLLTLALERESS